MPRLPEEGEVIISEEALERLYSDLEEANKWKENFEHDAANCIGMIREYEQILMAFNHIDPTYEYREIGESAWKSCTKEQYFSYMKLPEIDTRVIYTYEQIMSDSLKSTAMIAELRASNKGEVK